MRTVTSKRVPHPSRVLCERVGILTSRFTRSSHQNSLQFTYKSPPTPYSGFSATGGYLIFFASIHCSSSVPPYFDPASGSVAYAGSLSASSSVTSCESLLLQQVQRIRQNRAAERSQVQQQHMINVVPVHQLRHVPSQIQICRRRIQITRPQPARIDFASFFATHRAYALFHR